MKEGTAERRALFCFGEGEEAMRRKEVHTVPNPDGAGWVNEVNGKITSEHRKQSTASEAGRRQAIQRETEHVIHNRYGQIRDKNSYGNDPYPPKG